MTVDDQVDSYYPYKQPGSVPFKWEIRPGVPKYNYNHNLNPPPPQPQPATPTRTISSPKLKPPPPISFHNPLEEPRTRSFLSAPRTRSSISLSSPRVHSQRIVSAPQPGPDLVGIGCFPSPSKHDRMSSSKGSRRRSQKVESEFGFEFGPDYGSDLEILVRWSNSIAAMKKSNAAFQYSSPDSSTSWSTSPSPVTHAEWAALNLF